MNFERSCDAKMVKPERQVASQFAVKLQPKTETGATLKTC